MAAFGENVLGKGIVYAKDTPNFVANRIITFEYTLVAGFNDRPEHARLLVALLGLVDRHDSWNFDDGAYAIQVAVLRDGHGGSSWAYPYRHADRDPASLFAPVSHSTVTSEGSFPYVKQPVWVEAMRATMRSWLPMLVAGKTVCRAGAWASAAASCWSARMARVITSPAARTKVRSRSRVSSCRRAL